MTRNLNYNIYGKELNTHTKKMDFVKDKSRGISEEIQKL